jgi:hypothetical protein
MFFPKAKPKHNGDDERENSEDDGAPDVLHLGARVLGNELEGLHVLGHVEEKEVVNDDVRVDILSRVHVAETRLRSG